MIKYLVLDTEHGGFNSKCSLLSVGIIVADENFNEQERYEENVCPDDKLYIVEAEAMAINKIDLVEHYKTARTYTEAGKRLYESLYHWSRCGANKLTVIGKQVDGDLLQLEKLISKRTREQYISHRVIEVSSIFLLMKDLGFYKTIKNGSLKELAEHYKLDTTNQHDALYDAELTLKVYSNMVRQLKEYTLL